ncbi:uncharacterized protein [Clytia hemisphaerica]|uniref:Uncharacterized protein n=2 Tax=Clytia hemisphaerica TaxID=252671 RepID=A0A7M5UP84_9CNID
MMVGTWTKLIITFWCLVVLRGQQVPLDPDGFKVCEGTVSYKTTRRVSTTVSYAREYKTCSLTSLWGGCLFWAHKHKYRTAYRKAYRSVHEVAYRKEHICCPGWKQQGDSCPIPVCERPCEHGTCISITDTDNNEKNICQCDQGWRKEEDTSSCDKDIDECATLNGNCDHICQNTDGSYVCSCRSGYKVSSNPKKCEDINECLANNKTCMCVDQACTATCKNIIGSHLCECSVGFHTVNNRICQDTNECLVNKGGCSDICVNEEGRYHCQCPTGHQLKQDNKTCDDINECLTQNGGCAHHCNNTDGSFECYCREGYFLDANKKDCSDHNECATTNHGCQYKCENTQGGYICTCPKGFELDKNNKNCIDINECEVIVVTSSGRNTTIADCSSGCLNLNGTYKCTCPPGWLLLHDGKTCADYDECLLTTRPLCSDTCVNTIGSYKCICADGYRLADNKKDCQGEPCVLLPRLENGDSTCLSGITGTNCSFSCKEGFELIGSERRQCMPSHKWSGTQTECKRLSCDALDPPFYTSLRLPCDHIYQSTCHFKCKEGYYQSNTDSTRSCMTKKTSNNNVMMQWSNEDLKCLRYSSPCDPNPCSNSGVCKQNGDAFICYCSANFTGARCQTPTRPEPIITATTQGIFYSNAVSYTGTIKKLCNEETIENLKLKVSSNIKFDENSFTNGIVGVQAIGSDARFPVSLSGGTFNDDGFVANELVNPKYVQNIVTTSNDQCLADQEPSSYLPEILQTYKPFTLTFLEAFNSKLPYWIHIISNGIALQPASFNHTDVTASLKKGEHLDQDDSCFAGFKVSPDHVYYVYKPTKEFLLTLPLGDGKAIRRVCFIVDLTSSTVVVTGNFQNIKDVLITHLLVPFGINSGDINYFGYENQNQLLFSGATRPVFVDGKLDISVDLNGYFKMDAPLPDLYSSNSKTSISTNKAMTNINITFEALSQTEKLEITDTKSDTRIETISSDVSTGMCQTSRVLTSTLGAYNLKLPTILKKFINFVKEKDLKLTLKDISQGHTSKPSVGVNDQQELQKAITEFDNDLKYIQGLKGISSKIKSQHEALIKAQNSISTSLKGFQNSFASKAASQIVKETSNLRQKLSEVEHQLFYFSRNYVIENQGQEITSVAQYAQRIEKVVKALGMYTVTTDKTGIRTLLELEGSGDFCISPDSCFSGGNITLIAGKYLNSCSSGKIIMPTGEDDLVILYEVPNDVYIGSTFKVLSGEKIQLIIPSMGDDKDVSLTFKGNWELAGMSFQSNVKLNTATGKFQVKDTIKILNDNVKIDITNEDNDFLSINGDFDTSNLTKNILTKFKEIVSDRKKRFESEKATIQRELKTMKATLEHQVAKHDAEDEKLKEIKEDISKIEGEIKQQTSLVDAKRKAVHESLDGNLKRDEFMQKCALGPNYCQQYCLSHLEAKECLQDSKQRIIFKVEHQCREENYVKNIVKINGTMKLKINEIKTLQKVECENNCPLLFGQKLSFSESAVDFDKLFHCYRTCDSVQVPVLQNREITKPIRDIQKESEKVTRCTNIFQQMIPKPGQPYDQEKELCYHNRICATSIDQMCLTNVTDCKTKIQSMASSSTSGFKVAFDDFTKEVNTLEIMKKRKETLDQVSRTQQHIVVFYNNIITKTREYLSNLHTLETNIDPWSSTKLSKFQTGAGLQITDLSFEIKHELGQSMLPNLPLRIQSKDYKGDTLKPVNVLFDVKNENQAIFEAADSLIDMIEEKAHSSLCYNVETSAVYLNNFVLTVDKLIKDYENTELAYFRNVTKVEHENKQLYDQIVRELSNASNIDSLKTDLKKLIPSYIQWNVTFSKFMMKLQSSSHGYGECYSFEDCIDFHMARIKRYLTFKDTSFLQSYEELGEILKKLMNDDLDINQAKEMSKSAKDKMSKQDPVVLFCGLPPSIKYKLNNQISVKEYEELSLSVIVTPSNFEYFVTWRKDNVIIPGHHKSDYQKNATMADEGWYSCHVENKFGSTECGVVKVDIIAKPIFHYFPKKVTVYEKSPKKYQYLTCNVTGADRLQWVYQPFDDTRQTEFSGSQFWFNASPGLEWNSGYYWCDASNDGFKLKSPIIAYSRQAVQNGITVTKITIDWQEPASRRRRRSSRKRRQIPSDVSARDLNRLKYMLSLELKVNADAIKELKYIKNNHQKAKVTFTLEGKDFNSELSKVDTWDDLTDQVMEDRRSTVSKIETLNNTLGSSNWVLENGQALKFVPSSMELSKTTVKCSTGFGLIENGFMCGQCPAGSRSIDSRCVPCTKNFYQPKAGQTTCLPCSFDHVTDDAGAISPDECKTPPSTLAPPTTSKPQTPPIINPSKPTQGTGDKDTQGVEENEDDNVIIIAPIIAVVLIFIIIIVAVCFIRHRRSERQRKMKTFSHDHIQPTSVINPSFVNGEDPYARIPFQDDEDVYTIPEKSFKKANKSVSQKRLIHNAYEFDGPPQTSSSTDSPYVPSSSSRPKKPSSNGDLKKELATRAEPNPYTAPTRPLNTGQNADLSNPCYSTVEDVMADKQRIDMSKPSSESNQNRAIPNNYTTVDDIEKPDKLTVELGKDNTVPGPGERAVPNVYVDDLQPTGRRKAPPLPTRRHTTKPDLDNTDNVFEKPVPAKRNTVNGDRPPIPERRDLPTYEPVLSKKRMQSRSSVSKDSANQYESLGPHDFNNKGFENDAFKDDNEENNYDKLDRQQTYKQ